MIHRSVPRLILTCLAALLLVPLLAAAQDTSAAQIEIELRLERKLLALDLASYREARGMEQRTSGQVTEVASRLDQALTGTSMSLGTLESLHLELSSARAASRIAAERVEWQLLRLEDRLRRIGFLETEAGRPAAPRDPVSGRWRISLQPQNQNGTMELALNGTLVSGSYSLDNGGGAGSYRGTYADNRLRLERVDSRRGFDSTFLGSVDPATGRLSGTWTAKDLASGMPAQGDWSAARDGAGNERQP